MAKSYINITKMAEDVGLQLRVSLSHDKSSVRFDLIGNGPRDEPMETVEDVYRWLDGYRRGRAKEQADGLCL